MSDKQRTDYELMQILDKAKQQMELILEQQKLCIRMRRTAYVEALAAGFTEDQAMQICQKNVGG